MKKILKLLLSRIVLVGLSIIIQITIIIVMLLEFSSYFVWFYAFCAIASLAAVLWIINSDINPAFKLAWVIPILLFPIFGGLFYLLFGRNKSNRRIIRSVQVSAHNYRTYLDQDPSVLDEINALSKSACAQAEYLQRYSCCPVYRNSTSRYFPSGEKKFEALVAELEKAEHFIFLEYFIIQEGYMWNTVLEILERKVKQGVDVRALYDDMGCLFTLPFRYNRVLEKKGIKCCVFNPFVPFLSTLMNNRDHRKIVVIDGHTAFTGGVNLADEYINRYQKHGHWKDASIMIRGEAVWNFTVMFLSQWESVRHVREDYERYRPHMHHVKPFEADGYVLPYSDNPLDLEPVCENAYLNLINRATEYVYINTPYLILDNEMTVALCNAAKSGIDVRIVTPHIPDKRLVYAVTRANYAALVKSGIKIYEYTPGFIHSKTVVCDDEYAVVGTVNFDYRSFYMHFECAAWLYRTSSIHDVRDDFIRTLDVCHPVALAECRNAKWYQRLGCFILRVFSPVM